VLRDPGEYEERRVRQNNEDKGPNGYEERSAENIFKRMENIFEGTDLLK
jgi:hypothetical protein